MIEMKNNFALVAQALQKQVTGVVRACEQGMRDGMREFERNIIKSYMSGRPGLNAPTGNLKNSWRIDEEGKGTLDYHIRLGLLESAWYGKVHEHLDFDGWIRPKNPTGYLCFKIGDSFYKAKKVYIPQRMHVREYWAQHGYRMLADRIEQRAMKAIQA